MSDWILADGYRFAGVHAGMRPDPARLDLGLVVSDRPAAAAGVFTRSRSRSAFSRCQERLPRGDARGVVVCSGNANACTGPKGLEDARPMTKVAAEMVGCQEEQMLVCSTGVIGRHLPMDKVEAGIRLAGGKLAADRTSAENVAGAILTTDTRIKTASQTLQFHGESPFYGIGQRRRDDRPQHGNDVGVLLHRCRCPPGRSGRRRPSRLRIGRSIASAWKGTPAPMTPC